MPIVEDFETGTPLPTIGGPDRAGATWRQYEKGDNANIRFDIGTESIITGHSVGGDRCLRISMKENLLYCEYYNYNQQVFDWLYMHENVQSYQYNTYNRLRYFIKPPADIKVITDGRFNTNVGTYVRDTDTDRGESETGNSHYYHRVNLGTPGRWQQVILDWHPSHKRGAGGNDEIGLVEHPFPVVDPARNYFDAMTRLYFDADKKIDDDGAVYPMEYLLDNFEVYSDPNETDDTALLHVASITGGYEPDTNTFTVTWAREKASTPPDHEWRYAFSDIHALTWAGAVTPSSPVVSPLGSGGYNQMMLTTTEIDVTSQDFVYFAIRQVGDSDAQFRQIVIPKDEFTLPPLPGA